MRAGPAPCFVEASRGDLVPLKAVEVQASTLGIQPGWMRVEAEGFEHSIIGWFGTMKTPLAATIGGLAIGGRTGRPDVPQQPHTDPKALSASSIAAPGRLHDADRGSASLGPLP